MRGLSIKQPWLYCITDSDKRVENRTWKPYQTVIGDRIALHASKKTDRFEYMGANRIVKKALELVSPPMDFGAIVATARLLGYVKVANGKEKEIGGIFDYNPFLDKWFRGPIGWVLSDVRKLQTPIPCMGSLGLWLVSPLVFVEINRQECNQL